MDKISEKLGAATGIMIPGALLDENGDIVIIQDDAQLPTETSSTEVTLAQTKKKNQQEDYEFARSNLKNILNQTMNLIPGAVTLAREAESPRSYESLSTFIKTITDINKDLISLSDSKESSSGKKLQGDQTAETINNAVFIGSTEDLLSRFPGKIINQQ